MPHGDMPITLWTEHGSGYRSPAFFARIGRSLGDPSKSACYCVPNAMHRRVAETLCLANGPDIFFGDRILSHHAWCDQLAASKQPLLPPNQRRKMLSHLLPTLTLDYYRTTSSLRSTVDTIAHGITSALSAGITAAELTQLAHDYGQEREQDLARMYGAYLTQLMGSGFTDPAQIPGLALNRLKSSPLLPFDRVIMDIGLSPSPMMWDVLRVLGQQTSTDLHVIVPETHRSLAETRLGEQARPISAEEWVATSPASPQLHRAPNVAAEYRWLSERIHQNPDLTLITADGNTTRWLAQCMSDGLIRQFPLPLPLAASPLSRPWHDPACWAQAPTTATLTDWSTWWRSRLYPPEKIQAVEAAVRHDCTADRALQHISQWESLWRHAATDAFSQTMTATELRDLIDPMLHNTSDIPADLLPVTIIPLDYCLGNHLQELVVLDATQDLFPTLTSSAFFRRAERIPQDPHADPIRHAFPGSDDLLGHQLAAWQRLLGSADRVIGIYSATHDTRGEQFPSPFFEDKPDDIVVPTQALPHAPKLNPLPIALLHDTDTIAHVRTRMQDHLFSVTELETFAGCPFRHFSRYILGIDPPDEELPELPARDEGQIIHRLLEQFYLSPADTRDDAAIRARLSDILTRTITTADPLRQIQIERLLTVATGAILWDRDQIQRQGKEAPRPTHLEWTFGAGDVPALVLHDGDAPVWIRGKVDRIDCADATQKMVLIDYKFRRQEVSSILADIRKGLHLQIPLYIMAAHAAFPNHHIAGGLLFDLNALHRHYGIAHKEDGDWLGIRSTLKSLVTMAGWEELLGTAEAHATRYARQIREGRFPLEDHQCEYCEGYIFTHTVNLT